MRKLIEAVEAQEISEGKYGPHGFGRRVNDAVDGVFDRHLDRLGNEPTVEEIYDAVRAVRRDLADQELMGFPRTNDYINKQFIGAVAEKLELPGLYSPSGKVFYSVQKDDAGRYTGSGGASRRVAQELAEKGYLSQEAAERLGVTNFLGLDITTGDPDSDENNAMRNTQTMASGRRQVRRDVARFLELLAKRNATSNEGVVYESALARLLTEALDDDEEREFQELMAKIKDLPLDAYQDDEETLNAVRDAQERISNLEPEAEPEAQPTDSGEDDANSRDSGADSGNPNGMSLADFAKSDKGGLKNDTNETRAITELQEFLKTMGWDIGTDGRYGPQTTGAVKEFQQLVAITDDGDAGPQTIEKILVWGKLPDVKTWAAQLKELNDLIEAGAVFQAPSNESVVHSIRSMMSLVESLFEEVTDQQQARAMELYNALKTKIDGDGEYMAALPEVLRTQLTAASEWARGEGGSQAGITPERAREIAMDFSSGPGRGLNGNDGGGSLGNIISGARSDEPGIQARLQELNSVEDWQLVVDAYRQVGNRAGRLRSGNLIQDLMGSLSSSDYDEYVKPELERIGVTPGDGQGGDDETGTAQPDATQQQMVDAGPRPAGSDQQSQYAGMAWDAAYEGYLDPNTGQQLPNARVPARPTGPDDGQGSLQIKQNAWDGAWAATHNTDGSPKQEEVQVDGP